MGDLKSVLGGIDAESRAKLRAAIEAVAAKDAAEAQAKAEQLVFPKEAETREEKLRHVFNKCDRDTSGHLDMQEYKKLSGETTPDPFITAVLDMIDAGGNSDGRVTVDEFVKFNLQNAESLSDADFDKQALAWLTVLQK